MAETGRRPLPRRRMGKNRGANRGWCCSLGVVRQSHESQSHRHDCSPKPPWRPRKSLSTSSFHSSPSSSSKISLGFMDPRRMLSPGRVSPIDSISAVDPPPTVEAPPLFAPPSSSTTKSNSRFLNLSLKGKNGRRLDIELNAGVLCRSSKFFAAMVSNDGRKASETSMKIEIAEIEDLEAFKDALQMIMTPEKDALKYLIEAGVSRAIDILEVSSAIMFRGGVTLCARYLEAVPWTEEEEQKLRILFARRTFDDPIVNDILSRLYGQTHGNSQDLAIRLVRSVVNGKKNKVKKELQALVSGLVSESTIYKKKPCGLTKVALYETCNSCFLSLVETLRGSSVDQVSREVDNLVWLFEILVDRQVGEDFAELWANQEELKKLHSEGSPMVRYEVSRITAAVFAALGSGKLQCSGEVRRAVLSAWFGPLLEDFGWLRRRPRRNRHDLKSVEVATGEAILTLALPEQQRFFMEWLAHFSEKGAECPNLGRAFEVWWRRSFQTVARGQRQSCH